MRKYRNLYQHDGKWYTKEKREAKVGEKVLIVNKSIYGNNDYKNGDVLTIVETPVIFFANTRYGSDFGQYLEQSEYVVLTPCATEIKVMDNDTYYDEMTSMEQQHNFIIQERGSGKKEFIEKLQKASDEAELKARFNSQPQQMIYEPAQPVPFSKEYYTEPKKLTQAEYDKMKEQLMQEADKMDARYGGTYRSVYVAAIEHTLAELKKRIVPKKRKWTEAEIEEARRTVLLYNMDTKYMVDAHNTNIVGAYWLNPKTKHYQCATATCMKNDTFDYWIGRMVACLKLHDKQLPEWVKGGK